MLGECAERHYGCHLAIGPPTEDGFFYEMGMQDDRYVWKGLVRLSPPPSSRADIMFASVHSQVTPADYPALETLVKSVVKEKQKFERLIVSKENLLKMFAVRVDMRPR